MPAFRRATGGWFVSYGWFFSYYFSFFWNHFCFVGTTPNRLQNGFRFRRDPSPLFPPFWRTRAKNRNDGPSDRDHLGRHNSVEKNPPDRIGMSAGPPGVSEQTTPNGPAKKLRRAPRAARGQTE